MEVKNMAEVFAAEPEGTFIDVLPFNGHNIAAVNITGVSPGWEMHPDTDEFFYVIEGSFELTLLFDDGPEHVVVPAGSTCVVPKGVWHKPGAPDGVKALYLTPGQSLTSDAEDPR